MKRIQKIGLSCLTLLLGVGLISGQVSADQYRTYQVGKDLNPGKYTVTSKNGTGDLYNSTYDFDFVLTNGKRKVNGIHKSEQDRKSTRLNSSHLNESRMPSSA